MTKEKWILIILGIMDFFLVVMHYADYVLFFLKPTGYVIPFIINIVIIIVIVFKSKLPKVWTIVVTIYILFISIHIILFYGFIVMLQDYSFIEIDSPYRQQSLVIEYRHATLGETTYFYNFYKTKFGFIGKRLNDQAITMMVRHYSSGIDAEGVLGLGDEEWITANTVRFYTWEGMKDLYISSSQPLNNSGNTDRDFENTKEIIGKFINKAKNNEDRQTITVNGNLLTIRYDEVTGQS